MAYFDEFNNEISNLKHSKIAFKNIGKWALY